MTTTNKGQLLNNNTAWLFITVAAIADTVVHDGCSLLPTWFVIMFIVTATPVSVLLLKKCPLFVVVIVIMVIITTTTIQGHFFTTTQYCFLYVV